MNLYSEKLPGMRQGLKILLSFMALLLVMFSNDVSNAQDKEKFKPYWAFDGNLFADYFYKVQGDTIYSGVTEYARTKKDYSGFALRRAKLWVRYHFTPLITGTVAIEGNDAVSTTTNERSFFVKLANISFKEVVPNSVIFAGLSPTPTYSLTSEPTWGYRSIEKTIIDMRGLGPSTDFGVVMAGTFTKSGELGYTVMFGNGIGNKILSNKTKKVYGSLIGRFADKKIIVEAYSDCFFEPVDKSRWTAKGFLGYVSESMSAGVEVVRQQQNNYYNNNAAIVPFGVSAFVNGSLIKGKLKAFARYDYFDNDTDYEDGRTYSSINSYYRENFVTAGIDFMPVSNIHLMPNIWFNSYSDKRTTGAVERKPDIVARFTFAYFGLPQ